MDDGHKKLTARTERRCRMPECTNKAEPRSPLCIECQLKGLTAPRKQGVR